MLISFFLWIIAIVAALIFMMIVKPKITRTTILCSGLFTIASGLLFYGYGYAYVSDSGAIAAIKTIFSVIRIFLGGNSFDDISSAPIFAHSTVEFLFWLLHFTGTFSTAAAALSTFGKSALRRLRLKLKQREELSVIYGISEQTVSFGQKLARHTQGNVVFVGKASEQFSEDRLQESGCHIRTDAAALEGSRAFLRSIGLRPGHRKFHLYCLSDDLFDNRIYAAKLLASMKAIGVAEEQTALTLQTSEQLTINTLQAAGDSYGYGAVDLVDVPDLAARMLMLRFPPYETLSFAADGTAKEDFRCAIVGFGEVGQAVLRSLVMNGQFEGSNFHADIFDPNYSNRLGRMQALYPAIFDHYAISFHNSDGRGSAFYEYLLHQGRELKYIVLCAGSEQVNHILARELLPCMERFGLTARLCLCDRESVCSIKRNDDVEKYSLFDPAVLTTDALDLRAMELNYSYCEDSRLTARQEWQRCDYFSRISSRASADFADALAYMAGIDARQTDISWQPDEAMLETLSKTEHLRWCAFHYATGFTPMSMEEFDARCEQFMKEKESTGKGSIRVGKDLHTRRHICLTSWDALDNISKKENKATGRAVDYKQLDRNNVLALPSLLKTKKG